jgi:hypothetical protein
VILVTHDRAIQLFPALLAGQQRDDRDEQCSHSLPVCCQRRPQQQCSADRGRFFTRVRRSLGRLARGFWRHPAQRLPTGVG